MWVSGAQTKLSAGLCFLLEVQGESPLLCLFQQPKAPACLPRLVPVPPCSKPALQTPPAVQWLRLCLPVWGAPVQSLVGGAESQHAVERPGKKSQHCLAECFASVSPDDSASPSLWRLVVTLGFPGSAVVKNPPVTQETQETPVRSLGREDRLEEGMATRSSVLAWRSPWIEEPGGLQSTGSRRAGHD